MNYKRIFTIVIDSLGIGSMPDLKEDEGADTLGHIIEQHPDIHIPTLTDLGLLNLHSTKRNGAIKPIGYYTKMLEVSKGKDTLSGHWEMMGLPIQTPFKTFTKQGFPKELMAELSKLTGHGIIGNKAASGTRILEELGERAMKTKEMIIYTSADSVLQVCGHELSFGLDELYRCCEIARKLTMKPEWSVGRVIARPYIGNHANDFQRTSNRRDYALKPFQDTVLNALKKQGLDVIGIGKIHDIFDGEGITRSFHSESSVHGMKQTLSIMKESFHGLCFVNLVDFDAKWGHRRDPIGYANELESFDQQLHLLLGEMKEDDLLLISADHGNDPTYSGSDHTKEMVPFLAYSPSMKGYGLLPLASTFAIIGATIANNFDIAMPHGTIGTSVLHLLH